MTDCPTIDPRDIYVHEEDGMIKSICIYTGRLLKIRHKYDDASEIPPFIRHVTPEGDVVFLEKGLALNESMFNKKRWAYSKVTADILCTRIANGGRITKLCEEPDMPPYAIVRKWRSEFPEFEGAYLQACKDRTEHFVDEALDVADEAIRDPDKEVTPAAKLKIETLKWAAAVGDPERYGTKTKIVGDGSGAIQLIVNTGILREGDPGYTEPIDVTPPTEKLEQKQHPRSQDESEESQGKVPEENNSKSDDGLLDMAGLQK